MKPIHTFLIKPKKERYDNIKKINDTELILNSGITDHKFVSREAIIHEPPIINGKHFTRGTELYVHHNIFRRWHDVRGIERNSKSYFKNNLYFCEPDQIFLYKHEGGWKANDGFCFIKPLANEDKFSVNKEKPLMGIVKYTDDSGLLTVGEKIGFTPDSEYEFIINNERLYRVMIKEISIKYEYKEEEREYNPSWL
jgi:uncharacterized protein YneR|tara:strand:+ start:33 stop:620 length:588 start_codon:yes stop_codon:yes gene_type:complete